MLLLCGLFPMITIGLWWLYHASWFLKSRIGRFLIRVDVRFDINRTILPGDKTDGSTEGQANEMMAKDCKGRVLKNEKKEYSWELSVLNPYMTYEEFLLRYFQKDRKALMETATHFNHPLNLYASECKQYEIAIKENKLFDAFFVFLETIMRRRRIYVSLHTFGIDDVAPQIPCFSVKRLMVTYDLQHRPYYTEYKLQDGKTTEFSFVSMSEHQFFNCKQQVQDTMFIVQEDYKDWKENNGGKRFTLFQHWFVITTGIIFDDVKCWKLSSRFHPRFVQVNSMEILKNQNYFVQHFDPSSILFTLAFWVHCCALWMVTSVLIYCSWQYWILFFSLHSGRGLC